MKKIFVKLYELVILLVAITLNMKVTQYSKLMFNINIQLINILMKLDHLSKMMNDHKPKANGKFNKQLQLDLCLLNTLAKRHI